MGASSLSNEPKCLSEFSIEISTAQTQHGIDILSIPLRSRYLQAKPKALNRGLDSSRANDLSLLRTLSVIRQAMSMTLKIVEELDHDVGTPLSELVRYNISPSLPKMLSYRLQALRYQPSRCSRPWMVGHAPPGY